MKMRDNLSFAFQGWVWNFQDLSLEAGIGRDMLGMSLYASASKQENDMDFTEVW